MSQISYLARQACPGNSKYVEEAYKDATHVPHGYLLLDLKQCTPDNLRLRTTIRPNENDSRTHEKKHRSFKANRQSLPVVNAIIKKADKSLIDSLSSPQQGDLRLSSPPSGQGAGGGARTRDRRVPADLRADSDSSHCATDAPKWLIRYQSR
ncbi:hypothetical protein PoB_004894600 [Plakobranchus ocellatus]|uniref:Uncharacterized protein n=1 Tax=Plakobranchus ocellatus TaxID=259542 RepID=A0AAV4BTQ2_9GAST|nr:hypothetical protein PoB_004894600 [Plakobranchus ocellatus]